MKEKKCERSVARLYAVLAIFQHEHSDCKPGEIVADFLSKKNKNEPKIEGLPICDMHIRFFRELFEKVVAHLDEINLRVKAHLAKDWSIDTIDPVALCILQLGVCEICYFETNPAKVILKEYADVAAAFFNSANTAFINGILNVIAREVRPDDKFTDREAVNERDRS